MAEIPHHADSNARFWQTLAHLGNGPIVRLQQSVRMINQPVPFSRQLDRLSDTLEQRRCCCR